MNIWNKNVSLQIFHDAESEPIKLPDYSYPQ